MTSFPVGLILIFGALVLPFLKGTMRQAAILILPAVVLGGVWMVPDGPQWTFSYLGLELVPVEGSTLGRVFATVFAITAFAGGLFSLNNKNVMEIVAAFVYAGSAIGVAMAGDILTVFVFWELMAVASTLVIWSSGTKKAYAASMRYVMVHLLGGVLLMVGVVAHVQATGSTDFGPIGLNGFAGWMILLGFLVNVGAPPLSAWVPDAYPEASWSGTVFLSAYTTKTAVYVLLVAFAGADVLIYVGLYMIFYGIIYALLENDVRRILAYSIVNQVGFMVVAAGIGTAVAINAAAAHAFAHIIYKALLLMSAGSVLYMTGKSKCTDLGGLYRSMPITAICGIIGALAISSFPFTSGFISKTMINAEAGSLHMFWVWMALEAASASAFLYVGLKFPWFVFFQKDSGMRPADPPWNMKAAMVICAALCIGIGIFPGPLYAILPFEVTYQPYTVAHVVNMLNLLLFAGLAFFVALPFLKHRMTITLDFDWFYRRFGRCVALIIANFSFDWIDLGQAAAKREGAKLWVWLGRHLSADGTLGRTRQAGAMVGVVILTLIIYLAVYYAGG